MSDKSRPFTIRHVAGAEAPPWAVYDADVVILALERAEETVAAINSALGQVGVSRYVIVVDQGSGADSLARLAAAVRDRIDATLVTVGHNLGVPERPKHRHRDGTWVVSSLAWTTTRSSGRRTLLARMAAGFDADPDLAALGCRIVVHGTGEDDLTSWGYPDALLPSSRETFEAATFVGAGHAIRRAAWDDVGGYDARLFFCWEEYDFCARAMARFWRIRYRGDIVVRHKVSPERRVTWSGDRWFHFVRNRLYIGRKSGHSWLALTPRMAGYCIKATRNGCLRETPRALWAASPDVARRGARPATSGGAGLSASGRYRLARQFADEISSRGAGGIARNRRDTRFRQPRRRSARGGPGTQRPPRPPRYTPPVPADS